MTRDDSSFSHCRLANYGSTYAPVDLARAAEDAGVDRVVVVEVGSGT